ncbi:MAG: hypothetical protein KAT34_03850 [Candidatus Aminicenantes bacterium]|nr:hypothetical protein [Candidatus Aminicenantes bacterium]
MNRYFPDKGSPVKVWIWPMWIVLTITLVNVVYARWYFIKTGLSTPEHFQPWPVITGTLALGTLCIFIIEMIDQNIRLKQNLKTQQLANQKLKDRLPGGIQNQKNEELLLINSQNDRDTYRFNPGNLFFMNAQGFRLFLDQVQDVVPVSRSYVPEFREIVRKYL